MELNDLTGAVIGAAIEVHKTMGPGFPESYYRKALILELKSAGYRVEENYRIPVVYKGSQFGEEEIGMLIEDQVVIEIRVKEELKDLDYRQMLSHIKMADKPCGLMINFNVARLKDGIRKMMNLPHEEPKFEI